MVTGLMPNVNGVVLLAMDWCCVAMGVGRWIILYERAKSYECCVEAVDSVYLPSYVRYTCTKLHGLLLATVSDYIMQLDHS